MPKCTLSCNLSIDSTPRPEGLPLCICLHSPKECKVRGVLLKKSIVVFVLLAILNQRNLNGKCLQREGDGGEREEQKRLDFFVAPGCTILDVTLWC